MDPGLERARERGSRPRPQLRVFPDQRPVEVAGEGLDGARERVGQGRRQDFWVRKATRSATCLSFSCEQQAPDMIPFEKPGTM